MAHEIEQFEDGTAAFVSARLDAWHRLGTVLESTFTAEEAMQHAKLGGWNVRKLPLTAQVGDSMVDVPGKYATIRDNPVSSQPEVLGVVGELYQVFQNEQHCQFLNTLVDESGAHFETAGSLRGGREVFVTMRLPQHMTIGGEDELRPYIVALNSHDGTSNFRVLTTMVRVVCANTQAAALRSNLGIHTIHHTGDLEVKVEEVRAALGLSFTYLSDFQAEAEKMLATPLREVDFVNKVRRIFPAKHELTDRGKGQYDKKILFLRQLFAEASTNENIRGTRWAGYQAVTEYLDHYAPVRAGDDPSNEREAFVRAEKTLVRPSVVRRKTAAFKAFAVN